VIAAPASPIAATTHVGNNHLPPTKFGERRRSEMWGGHVEHQYCISRQDAHR
jgi:hypothetical protein